MNVYLECIYVGVCFIVLILRDFMNVVVVKDLRWKIIDVLVGV